MTCSAAKVQTFLIPAIFTTNFRHLSDISYRTQVARLVCYHPSTDQMINYRIHTNSEGVVIKVEKEKKTKSKVVWEELKPIDTP